MGLKLPALPHASAASLMAVIAKAVAGSLWPRWKDHHEDHHRGTCLPLLNYWTSGQFLTTEKKNPVNWIFCPKNVPCGWRIMESNFLRQNTVATTFFQLWCMSLVRGKKMFVERSFLGASNWHQWPWPSQNCFSDLKVFHCIFPPLEIFYITVYGIQADRTREGCLEWGRVWYF